MDIFVIWGCNAAYIAAIALQLAAALLLVGNSDTTRKRVIMEYCEKHTALAFKKDGTMIDRTVLEQIVKTTWINRIAFIYLFVGYLIGIFGDCTIDKFWALLFVGALVLVLFVIPFKHAKVKAEQFPSITKDEIPNKDGVVIIEFEE